MLSLVSLGPFLMFDAWLWWIKGGRQWWWWYCPIVVNSICYELLFSSKHVFTMLLPTLFYCFLLTCVYLKLNVHFTYFYLAFILCVHLEAYTFLLHI